RAFAAKGVKLEFAPYRSDLPLLMAARGEQALALAGRIADGLLLSNMCPAEFTAHAVSVATDSAEKAGRPPLAQIVQYLPCAVRMRASPLSLARARRPLQSTAESTAATYLPGMLSVQ